MFQDINHTQTEKTVSTERQTHTPLYNNCIQVEKIPAPQFVILFYLTVWNLHTSLSNELPVFSTFKHANIVNIINAIKSR